MFGALDAHGCEKERRGTCKLEIVRERRTFLFPAVGEWNYYSPTVEKKGNGNRYLATTCGLAVCNCRGFELLGVSNLANSRQNLDAAIWNCGGTFVCPRFLTYFKCFKTNLSGRAVARVPAGHCYSR